MFEEFIKNGKVRKGEPDIALSKCLVSMSGSTLSFARSVQISEGNASPILVNYYEALRELCESICAKQGYKVYSHEAFTVFLKEILSEEKISEIFDRLRKLRNSINYYGEYVSKEETIAASKDVVYIIEILKKKYIPEE